MTTLVTVHAGAYHDSVALMSVSGAVNRLDGVDRALVAMATELNLGLLADLGFEPPPGVGPGDLLIAVAATDRAAAESAVATAHELLSRREGGSDTERGAFDPPTPRTTATAAAAHPPAGVVIVSTPGTNAGAEAFDAVRAGRHVMLFSDNVEVATEIALKDEAAERGVLVMGPDCGTVVLDGVGLGFANVVRPGPVSLVAASGTGAQQVCALLDAAGVGVRHVLGVGGRDLSAAVGARSTIAALRLLDADPAVEVIGLVAKTISSELEVDLARAVDELATPVLHIQADRPGDDLTAGTGRLLDTLETTVVEPSWGQTGLPIRGALRALYSGGTLAQEALTLAAPELGEISSNLREPELDPTVAGHLVVDLGADELTRGRPHPMIDQLIRLQRIEADVADPATAVLLLDVVLGHGAHPDPAAELAPVLTRARERRPELAVVVALVGTADDPQGRDHQAEVLAAAGAEVHLSNATAVRRAVALSLGSHP